MQFAFPDGLPTIYRAIGNDNPVSLIRVFGKVSSIDTIG